MLRVLFALLLVPLPFLTLGEESARDTDREAVERAVLDYVEGLYQAKPELIERGVHPELAKRGSWRPPESKEYRPPSVMTFEQLVALAAKWNADGQQGEDLKYSIDVHEVLDITASAKLTAKWGIDYMHLMKQDGKWKIIHVLWQSAPDQG